MKNNQFMKKWLEEIEQYLVSMIDGLPSHQEKLQSAMKHVVVGGGKRIRPMLVLASAQVCGAKPKDVLPAACALEMIHTYSLIHDDLPGMDDDSMRRGKPTIHVLYDEATAILSGDAFLTIAFEAICQTKEVEAKNLVQMVQALSKASGARGMIAGQMLDIASEEQSLTLEELKQIHQEKTGKLIQVAMQIGCLAGNPSNSTKEALEDFATHYGLAFQIQNDLQDVLWDSQKTGKETGKDQALEKNTYPSLMGIAGAKLALEEEVMACQKSIEQLPLTSDEQLEAAQFLADSLQYLTI
ncbi:farnesyl-diphosphate synthase [Granulicatella balaenopterae]|uniref:Farnesyl diphosphate synthase n=1 Tax=Granulicatella balaenopterae TaxID=137733 RepID=A0A1H9GQJ4_9LACT|nr:farnesyl diphosphate synthase [Granulicatella balaenopterae]SEQ52351.1 farnesyl-diphosphate synthase [Granulicatella balaenopterae]